MQEGISEHGSTGNLLFTFEEWGLQHSIVLYSSNSKVCSCLLFLSWLHVQLMGLKGSNSEQVLQPQQAPWTDKAWKHKTSRRAFLLLTILPDPQVLAMRQCTVGGEGGSKGCHKKIGTWHWSSSNRFVWWSHKSIFTCLSLLISEMGVTISSCYTSFCLSNNQKAPGEP